MQRTLHFKNSKAAHKAVCSAVLDCVHYSVSNGIRQLSRLLLSDDARTSRAHNEYNVSLGCSL